MKNITIAIDGHSSCGKSTIAKKLARSLGYVYIDTGAMYRAVSLFAIRSDLFETGHLNKQHLISSLDDLKINFVYNNLDQKSEVILNGENIESLIRGMEVSSKVSEIATIKEVREKMVAIQREMGKNKGVVMDGRDIGSVVFPNAELKLFVTARDEVRAQRRMKELSEKGETVSFEEVLENIQSRDFTDSTRAESPLIQTEDAIVLDNSDLSFSEQNQMVLSFAEKAIEKAN